MARSRRRAERIAIIGTGLIGASIGLALRANRRPALVIAGWDRRRDALRAASRRGAITRGAASLEDAVENADIVILAAPLEAIVTALPRAIAAAKPGALVIDVGPVKAPIIVLATRALRRRPEVGFVSGHPMAGAARAGTQYADPRLLAGRPFALVAPPQRKRARAIAAAGRFVRRLGAIPIHVSARTHDRLVAATSALPQLISIALALAVEAAARDGKQLAGPGYADATRLAESPFHIWRASLRCNRTAVNRALRAFERVFRGLMKAAERGDEEALARLFSRAAAARRRVVRR